MSTTDEVRHNISMKEILNKIARDAGAAILKVYTQDFNIVMKADKSPVTDADHAANEVILIGLAKHFPDITVISEENIETHDHSGNLPEKFFIIDPLDGTKEFIKKNDEFTVNIGFIEKGFPAWGVVYVPVTDTLYCGGQGLGAERNNQKIVVNKNPASVLRVVGSRSHLNQETEDFLTKWNREYEFQGVGSSVKFCMVADGSADVYPRIGPIKEWDTAAAQAVVEGAGGLVIDAFNFERLSYGKKSLLSPSFVCVSSLEVLGNLGP